MYYDYTFGKSRSMNAKNFVTDEKIYSPVLNYNVITSLKKIIFSSERKTTLLQYIISFS